MLSGDIAHAIEHARRAAELAERAGETAMLIESLGTLCHYETYTGPITPGLLERAVELERAAPRPSNNYSPREILGLRLMYADRLDEARELLEERLDWTAEIGDELDRNSLLIHLTQLECRAGRPSRAAQHAKEGLTISEQTGGWALAAPLFAVSLAAAHLGDVPAAREAGETGLSVAESGGSGVFRVLNQWALGFLALSLGDAPGADRRLHELPGELEAMGYRNPGVRPVYPDAIEATDHVGRPRRGAPDRPARGVRPGAGQPLGPGRGGAMPWSAPGVAGGHRRRDRRAGARPGRARALASAPRAGQDAAGTGSGPASGQAEARRPDFAARGPRRLRGDRGRAVGGEGPEGARPTGSSGSAPAPSSRRSSSADEANLRGSGIPRRAGQVRCHRGRSTRGTAVRLARYSGRLLAQSNRPPGGPGGGVLAPRRTLRRVVSAASAIALLAIGPISGGTARAATRALGTIEAVSNGVSLEASAYDGSGPTDGIISENGTTSEPSATASPSPTTARKTRCERGPAPQGRPQRRRERRHPERVRRDPGHPHRGTRRRRLGQGGPGHRGRRCRRGNRHEMLTVPTVEVEPFRP